MKLNLQATTKEEQKVKAYLEANASEVLAEKINGGVRIQKDGKMLINKKTLAGFMRYACDEAKKQAEKGASSACIDDDTVYGWAVHYFEEDSIEGTLYNEDGTEYKAPMPKTKPVQTKPTPPMPKPKLQLSIFDMVSDNKPADEENEEPDDEPTPEDPAAEARMGSCVKHFVGYGAARGGRDKQFTELSNRTLLETYLPPFEACIRAGAVSVMSAFNDIAGIPASANPYTLRTLLKEQWGFDGFVLSDWDAVVELENHGIADSDADAAERALTAGLDVEMKSRTFMNLMKLVETGRIDPKIVDDAVRRVLRIKFRLGIFDHPYIDEEKAGTMQLTPEHRAAARRIAAESMVLLKNNGALPLSKSEKVLSLTGPFASNRDMIGWWTGHGRRSDVVTVVEGLCRNLPDSLVLIEGSASRERARTMILCVGESGASFGESHSLADISLRGSQVAMIREAKARGMRVVVVLFNGRPLAISDIVDLADAVLVAWHPGVEAGNAVADVLFGNINPCGKLTCSWPKHSGQMPLFYSDRTSGRPRENRYLDVDGQPLFPFGFGLSYTEFRYGNLQLSSRSISPEGTLAVRVDITNAGSCDGKEIVQLYVHDRVASVTRPRMELKDFAKVFIPAGETRTVELKVDARELALIDAACRRVVEPGVFDLWVGPNSRDGLLHAEFEVR